MRRQFTALVFAGALALAPGRALAAGWVGPLPEIRPILDYGSSYSMDGSARTHSGVDLAAEAGEGVRAVSEGIVEFAGRIPASQGGEQMLAVTLSLADGTRVTMMPFARIDVSRGQQVDAGERLGDLAGSGDGSSAESHLHLGAAVNGARIDPMTMLEVEPPPSSTVEEQPETAPERQPEVAPSTTPPEIVSDPPGVARAKPKTGRRPHAAPSPVPGPVSSPALRSARAPVVARASVRSQVSPLRVGPPVATHVMGSTELVDVTLLPLATRRALAEERAVPASRLPDVASMRRVRTVVARLVIGLCASAVTLVGMFGIARRTAPLQPEPASLQRLP